MDSEKFPNCLYLNEELSDVCLIVENEMTKWNYPVHSFVLKPRSPVFKKMLDGEFAEGKNRTIVIKNFKNIHVQQFLKFMYADILPEMYGSLCEVLKLSHMYMVTKLTSDCEQALMKLVNLQNVFELSCLSELYSLDKLRQKSLTIIKRGAFKLLKCDELEILSKEVMQEIVSADDLNVSSEMEVFWAVWKWGNFKIPRDVSEISKENVVAFIQDLLTYIRWNLLKKEDKDKIISLGITLHESVTQKVYYAYHRKPSTIDPRSFLELCDVVQLDKLASFCTFLQNSILAKCNGCILRFVSLSETPFYVVGMSIILQPTYPQLIKVTCTCGPVISTVHIPRNVLKHYEIEKVTYGEAMCEFQTPVLVCKNDTVTMCISDKFGTIELKFDANVIRYSNRTILCLEGVVYGITQLFLL